MKPEELLSSEFKYLSAEQGLLSDWMEKNLAKVEASPSESAMEEKVLQRLRIINEKRKSIMAGAVKELVSFAPLEERNDGAEYLSGVFNPSGVFITGGAAEAAL